MVSSSQPTSSQPNYLFPRTDANKRVQESLLQFHLVPNTTALISVSQLSEVIKVNSRNIVPIPQLPSWVMGIYNWRGEILWIVDLGGLIKLTPLPEQSMVTTQLPLVVLRQQDDAGNRQHLGLIVREVEGITRLDANAIQSPPASSLTMELAQVLRGYWLSSEGEMLMVLSGPAIFEQMPQSST